MHARPIDRGDKVNTNDTLLSFGIQRSDRFYSSIMERFYNHLPRIGNLVSKASEDDLRINPPDKTYKRKANDKENDEHVTRRTETFFYELVTKKRMTLPKYYYCQNPRFDGNGWCCGGRSYKERMREERKVFDKKFIKLREKGMPCSYDDWCSTSSSKKTNLKIHRRREVFTEDDGWDRASDFGI
nr:hypothetical protein [Tanacetum cinerariifolium]